MPSDRLLRILSRLAVDDGTSTAARLCVVCAEITQMSGAGIMLLAGDRPQGTVCTTDEVSAQIEELQYTLGEGPCVDAHRQHAPVIEPDLASSGVVRWAAFSRSAVAAGARAVFGFPVAEGDARIGALNLYRDRPGPLTAQQHADALIVADVAARSIIAMQAAAPPGQIAADLATSGNFRFVVHQAAGMVAVQLGVSVDEALVRIRAYAFTHDELIVAVAHRVLARRLRFRPSDETPNG